MRVGSLAAIGAAALASAGALAALESSLEEGTSIARCWAQLYELPNFSGDKLTVAGPVDLSAVGRAAGPEWKGPKSLVLGPDARLEATKPPGRSKITIGVGQDIPDFRNTEPPQLLDGLGDMRLDCLS